MRAVCLLALWAATACAGDVPRGQIVDDVQCGVDPSQSYALYLPSHYTPDRQWSAIFAFDPIARGRVAVEPFQAAAERYGYVVAGSNNARNGPYKDSLAAAQATLNDVAGRFSIDEKRVYTAGLSGGARVASLIALAGGRIAGVFLSGAGFPDGAAPKSASFAVLATVGTEDFNYLEMLQLDRSLTTPHRLLVFEGGHQWLSSDLAVEAVEWMEIQAMRSGLRARDEALVEKVVAARVAQAEQLKSPLPASRAWHALAADFDGLRNVTEYAARAAACERAKGVKEERRQERADQQRETELKSELEELVGQLGDASALRAITVGKLEAELARLSHQAGAAADSPERRQARRLLGDMIAVSRETRNSALQALLRKVQKN